jgi:branched-chain amino acid transport system ATP-binding protein
MGFTDVRGKVFIDGQDVTRMKPSRRPLLGVGYAPEDRRLFSGFTVEENITLPGAVAKLDRAEVAARLDKIYTILPELAEMADRPAGAVSGGQGKMVALGRALMVGTRLLSRSRASPRRWPSAMPRRWASCATWTAMSHSSSPNRTRPC